MTDREEIYSVARVADVLKVTPAYVRRLAVNLGVGRRVGKVWVFSEGDVEVMRSREDGRSRKPTPPTE